jgi:hypothetical protein
VRAETAPLRRWCGSGEGAPLTLAHLRYPAQRAVVPPVRGPQALSHSLPHSHIIRVRTSSCAPGGRPARRMEKGSGPRESTSTSMMLASSAPLFSCTVEGEVAMQNSGGASGLSRRLCGERGAQVNSRTHVAQKLTGLTSRCTNPVSILSVLFKPPLRALNPIDRPMAGFV